jgi:hypothetical protein
MGRFNRLLRWGGASHLTSLSIHIAPDDVEHSRMQVLEMRGLRLLELSLNHSVFPPRLPYHSLSPLCCFGDFPYVAESLQDAVQEESPVGS